MAQAGDLADLAADPEALDMCLPTLNSVILRGASPTDPEDSPLQAGRSASAVLLGLADVLNRQRMRSWLLPLIADLLMGRQKCAVEVISS